MTQKDVSLPTDNMWSPHANCIPWRTVWVPCSKTQHPMWICNCENHCIPNAMSGYIPVEGCLGACKRPGAPNINYLKNWDVLLEARTQ